MMSNHVDPPTALRLKEMGWVKETKKSWHRHTQRHAWQLKTTRVGAPGDWLHAPNVCEIGEDLSRINLRDYWWHVVKPEYRKGCSSASASLEVEVHYSSWLYSIMHKANELAKVWLWVNSNKKGE